MKMNIKKVATVLGSALMLGATAGMAAAAAYPAPFVQSGAANVAIVVGSNAANSDVLASSAIATGLATTLAAQTATGATGRTYDIAGGDAFKLDRSSKTMHLGNALNYSYSSLNSDHLKTFLADGTYTDGDVDSKFTQKIVLSDQTLELFADSDYNNKEPTVGFHFASGDKVLDYSMTFDKPSEVLFSDMNDTYLPLFGKMYYVSSADNETIVLLDSASEATVQDGSTVTLNGYEVQIDYITSSKVSFIVNGEATKQLSQGNTAKLADGSYIALIENRYAEKEAGVSAAKFSIGTGKITLTNNEDVEVEGDDDLGDGLKVLIEDTTDNLGLNKLTFEWSVDDESFVTENKSLVMPVFDAISLSFKGIEYSGSPETVTFENGEILTLKTGRFDLPLYTNSTGTTYYGDDDAENNFKFFNNASNEGTGSGNINVTEGDYFVVTSIPTDLSDVETLYYEVSKIDNTSTTEIVKLKAIYGPRSELSFKETGADDSKDAGEVSVYVSAVAGKGDSGTATINFAGTNLYSTKVVSEKGLVVTIPTNLTDDATVTFTEANKDEDVNTGAIFTGSVKWDDSEDEFYVDYDNSGSNVTKEVKVENKVYVSYTNSSNGLSTVITEDKDANEVVLTYYGKETPASVWVSQAGATVSGSGSTTTGATQLGSITVKDTEVSSVAGKNLIVVGGSCINSVAAELLGGAACEAAFTAKTGVKAGEALIQSFDRSGKVALLVAGYNAEDTTKAATYLVNKGLADSANTKLKVTSATEATAITA